MSDGYEQDVQPYMGSDTKRLRTYLCSFLGRAFSMLPYSVFLGYVCM
jgi:hypothetical protein